MLLIPIRVINLLTPLVDALHHMHHMTSPFTSNNASTTDNININHQHLRSSSRALDNDSSNHRHQWLSNGNGSSSSSSNIGLGTRLKCVPFFFLPRRY